VFVPIDPALFYMDTISASWIMNFFYTCEIDGVLVQKKDVAKSFAAKQGGK